MAFDLSKYETVDQRLEKFWKEYPDGRIETNLEVITEDRCVVKCYLYKTYLDSVSFATGIAEERLTSSHINKTSFVENCESSAIGRALHNGGISKHSEGKPRPTREEMEKVARIENDAKAKSITVAPADSWETFTASMPETVAPALDDVVSLLKTELGAEEVPQCRHGNRVKKTGTSKAGKPYLGWVCAQSGSRAAVQTPQCEPLWYTYVSQTGTFRAPDQTE